MRNHRYANILDPDKMSRADVVIVGVGAIGRQIAMQMAAMGVRSIKLIDFDTIDDVNLGTQGWFPDDIGKTKVGVMTALLDKINPDVDLYPLERRFNKGLDKLTDKIVFACADSMATRKLIFEKSIQDGARLFIDGRMAAESFRAFAVTGTNGGAEYYPETLFDDSEGFVGACGSRSTIYCSNVIAGVMIGMFAKWMRDLPVEKEIEMSIVGSAMEVVR